MWWFDLLTLRCQCANTQSITSINHINRPRAMTNPEGSLWSACLRETHDSECVLSVFISSHLIFLQMQSAIVEARPTHRQPFNHYKIVYCRSVPAGQSALIDFTSGYYWLWSSWLYLVAGCRGLSSIERAWKIAVNARRCCCYYETEFAGSENEHKPNEKFISHTFQFIQSFILLITQIEFRILRVDAIVLVNYAGVKLPHLAETQVWHRWFILFIARGQNDPV